MNLNSFNPKLIFGAIYVIIISIFLYFLFSFVNLSDLTSYEFIRENRDIILKYKNENFLYLAVIFFIFSIIWVLLLGFAMPLLLFSGFVFGKWWGIIVVLTSTTVGATMLYMLASYFFNEMIKEKLAPKFSKLIDLFNKNDLAYFTTFRFIGGLGTPYAVQNVLPILFNMSIKNYFIAPFFGSLPSMFVSVSLGSGIEQVIDKNVELSFSTVLYSPEIYIPLIAFSFILIIAFIIKKFYFKQ